MYKEAFSHKKNQGFTVIELIMVIVIMGVLSAYAASKINFASHDSGGYAEIIKSSVRLAQKLAIAKRTASVSVTFPVTCNGSTGVQVTGEQCDVLPNGVTVTGLSSLSFNGFGQPNIVTKQSITISGGGINTVIYVEPETGYVHE